MVSVGVLRVLLTVFSTSSLIGVRFDEKSVLKGCIDVWRIEGYACCSPPLSHDSRVFTLRGDPLYECSWPLDKLFVDSSLFRVS